jgi:hypothetical protein
MKDTSSNEKMIWRPETQWTLPTLEMVARWPIVIEVSNQWSASRIAYLYATQMHVPLRWVQQLFLFMGILLLHKMYHYLSLREKYDTCPMAIHCSLSGMKTRLASGENLADTLLKAHCMTLKSSNRLTGWIQCQVFQNQPTWAFSISICH